MDLPSDLPSWASPTPAGLLFVVPRTRIPRGWRQALVWGGVFGGILGVFAGPFAFLVSAVCFLGLVLARIGAAPVHVELTPDRLRVGEEEGLPRAGLRFQPDPTAGDPSRRRFTHGSGEEVLLERFDLSPLDQAWLDRALTAWVHGLPIPPRYRPVPVPSEVGRLEPGLQTIDLPYAPVQPRDLALGVGGIAGALVLTGALSGLAPPFGVLGVACCLALVSLLLGGRRGRSRVTLQIRQDALTVLHGTDRHTVPYADLLRVEAVRRTVHSEILLETRAGRVLRLPVPGFPIAATLELAIREAMERSGREAEPTEARRALDALRQASSDSHSA